MRISLNSDKTESTNDFLYTVILDKKALDYPDLRLIWIITVYLSNRIRINRGLLYTLLYNYRKSFFSTLLF